MIVKEARAGRWAVLVGLGVVLLRLLSVMSVDLKTQSPGTLNNAFDGDFSAVSAGHIAAGSAYL